jgi:methylphosphotriester-DNA--protein-cysteine methyltransferase
MLVSLKLRDKYDGFLFLAESSRNVPTLQSHHHRELEVNLVVQGTITYVVDGRRFTFSPRTLLWLFPQQEHQLVDRSPNAQFYVAVFKSSLIRRSCHSAPYEGVKNSSCKQVGVLNTLLNPASFDLICKTMDSLMEGSLDPDLLNSEGGFGYASNFVFEHGDPDALNAGLHYLLLLCWRSKLTGKVTRDATALHSSVRRALKILSDGDSEQKLETLAKSCGASKSYLSRTFHRQVGVPINHYRNSLRLSRFFEQYQQSDQKTITEAAYAAGFGSYAQFYKVFTRAYGRGPRGCLNPSELADDRTLR